MPASIENERPLKRVEYELLAAKGHFDSENVELLFGRVVTMSPVGPPHGESVERVFDRIRSALGDLARVRCQSAFAASEISEPQPDVLVIPDGDYWRENPSRAYLVVEVAESSLAKDRGVKAELYSLAEVDEYWIVDLVHGCIHVHRDRRDGAWETRTTHRRGEQIAMRAFPDVTLDVAYVLPPIDKSS